MSARLHSNLSNPLPGHCLPSPVSRSSLGSRRRCESPGDGSRAPAGQASPRALPTGARPAAGLGPLPGRRPQPGRLARAQLHPSAPCIPHPHFGSLGQPSARRNKAGHVCLGQRMRPGREGACAGAGDGPERTKGAQREGSAGPRGPAGRGAVAGRPVAPAPGGRAARPLSPEAAPPRGRAPGRRALLPGSRRVTSSEESKTWAGGKVTKTLVCHLAKWRHLHIFLVVVVVVVAQARQRRAARGHRGGQRSTPREDSEGESDPQIRSAPGSSPAFLPACQSQTPRQQP